MPKQAKVLDAAMPNNRAGATPLPATREMTVIAQDPSVLALGKQKRILMARIAVPAEDLIGGPTGYRVQVIDYDSTTRQYGGAHDLPSSVDN